MQQTRNPETEEVLQEFFKAEEKEKLKNQEEMFQQLTEKMDNRLAELEDEGHVLEKRVEITERQYNKAIASQQKSQKRKKKRKAQKLARRKNR